MAYLVLRALSHPLWLLEKTARVETLFIQESSAEKELISQRLLGGFVLGVEKPPEISPC